MLRYVLYYDIGEWILKRLGAKAFARKSDNIARNFYQQNIPTENIKTVRIKQSHSLIDLTAWSLSYHKMQKYANVCCIKHEFNCITVQKIIDELQLDTRPQQHSIMHCTYSVTLHSEYRSERLVTECCRRVVTYSHLPLNTVLHCSVRVVTTHSNSLLTRGTRPSKAFIILELLESW